MPCGRMSSTNRLNIPPHPSARSPLIDRAIAWPKASSACSVTVAIASWLELVDSCEEYGEAEADLEFGDDEEPDDPVETAALTRLRSSDLLQPDQVWPLQKAVPIRTVALVGDFRAGKGPNLPRE